MRWFRFVVNLFISRGRLAWQLELSRQMIRGLEISSTIAEQLLREYQERLTLADERAALQRRALELTKDRVRYLESRLEHEHDDAD